MNSRQAYIKLAQTRLAINYVLRTRAMQKQAAETQGSTNKGWAGNQMPLIDFNYSRRNALDPENAGRAAGGTVDDAWTMMNIKEPEKYPWSNWLITPWGTPGDVLGWGRGVSDPADKTRRIQSKRDPKEIEENKKWEGPH